MLDLLLSFLILAGALFTLIGSLGLARLPDFYTRLHGPTKATTLGVGSLLLASVLYFSTRGDGFGLHEVLVTLFLFITAPVSAHMMAKAALHLRLRSLAPVPGEEGEGTDVSGVDGA
jgi:multicomponent K+:H+ antiporter subunit G